MPVTTLYPTGDGTITSWTVTPSGPAWEVLNETGAVDTDDRISTTVDGSGHDLTFNRGSIPANAVISNIKVKAYIQTTNARCGCFLEFDGVMISPYRLLCQSTEPVPGWYETDYTVSGEGSLLDTAFVRMVHYFDQPAHSSVVSALRLDVTYTEANQPPTVEISTPVIVGRVTTCSFTSADPDGPNPAISVNWGDGAGGPAVSGQPYSHTYAPAGGTFTITASVYDGEDFGIDTAEVTVESNTAPAAVLHMVINGMTVYAVDSSTDSDGEISEVIVDWGDGTDDEVSPGGTLGHTYSAPGVYTITLSVTDNEAGTDTASETITLMELEVSEIHTLYREPYAYQSIEPAGI